MKHLFLSIILLTFSLFSYSQEPAVEIRAAWLTTNWMLDWPRYGKTVKEQKAELSNMLDELQKDNFNVILFQARAQGKAFYKSALEEASPYFNHANGFDPLAYAIEECHARGMECHAWITVFPVEQVKLSKKGVVLERKPDFYKRDGNRWFLDPGRQETKRQLVSITKEIVAKYDVDGLHLDYIRYPDNAKNFNDNDTYRQLGRGKSKALWRRENINDIVFDIYDAVKSIKNWVQVSSSPLGKYKALKSRDGWTAFESVHQDAGYWMQMGKHDILFPMMYTKGNDFYPYIEEWVRNSNNRPIVPGLGVFQLEEKERNWKLEEITEQIEHTRREDSGGQAYFRAGQILDNKKGVRSSIQQFYKYPAKLPPLTWLKNETPYEPNNFEVFKDNDGMLVLQWDAPTRNERYTYNVYFSNKEILDLNKAEGILAASLHDNFYVFPASVGEYGFYYFVTASDRYHNESQPAESVYFVHSSKVY